MIENIVVSVVKNGCGHSGLSTLKLVVAQEGIYGINWFLVCWYKFRKVKSYLNNFGVVMVISGRGLLGVGTLKSSASQDWIDEMSWFLTCWYKFIGNSVLYVWSSLFLHWWLYFIDQWTANTTQNFDCWWF